MFFDNVKNISPGMSMRAATRAEEMRSRAKERRAATELFMDGKALQQQEQAAEPKQHAKLDTKLPIQQPILCMLVVLAI